MAHVSPQVAADYCGYRKIRRTKKVCNTQLIHLEDKINHSPWQKGKVSLFDSNGVENGELSIELNPDHTQTFRINLRFASFMDAPCYRFDSDGQPHRNYDPEGRLPLSLRRVSTPHFHRFNREGIEWAYQTNQLRNNAAFYTQNYLNAMLYFCQEERIDIPSQITIKLATLPTGSCTYADPLEGAEFNDESHSTSR